MARKKRRVEIDIDINEDIGPPTDLESRAEILHKIAEAMTELIQATHLVLDDVQPSIIQERAHSYWLGHMSDMLNRWAEDGMEGIYGTIKDLEEVDE